MKEIVDEFEDIGFLYEAWPHMESLEVETGLTVLADGLRSRLFWDVGYLVGFDFLGVWFCCGVFLDTNLDKVFLFISVLKQKRSKEFKAERPKAKNKHEVLKFKNSHLRPVSLRFPFF